MIKIDEIGMSDVYLKISYFFQLVIIFIYFVLTQLIIFNFPNNHKSVLFFRLGNK